MLEELLFTDVVRNVVARMTSLLLPESTEKFLRDLTGPSWAILIVNPEAVLTRTLSGTHYFARRRLLPTRLPREPYSRGAFDCRR